MVWPRRATRFATDLSLQSGCRGRSAATPTTVMCCSPAGCARRARLNPTLPAEAREDAFRKLTRLDGANLIERNRAVHRLLVEGVPVEYKRPDGGIAGAQARVIDFADPAANDWLAVNQFAVAEGQHTRRPDVVLFVNGLPLAVLELKNAAAENATIWAAHQQLQTYQAQIPALFATNAVLVVADGPQARIGCLGAGKEWFKPWRTIGGREDAAPGLTELEVLLAGVFDRRRFLDLLRYFVVFEDAGGGRITKKMAGYHQFHAVNVAVEETLRAAQALRATDAIGQYAAGHQPGGEPGDRRVGVVWHTQGSGKSLTMTFYAGRLILHPGMENPTLVVLTDRNDLDDQLFGTFALCRDLLRQDPVQAADRADLRAKLQVASGGVVFTTIQKFFPDERGDRHRSCPTGGTSSSSPTKPTAASTSSSTALPATCATRCPTPRSSASPAPRSSTPTPTPAPCSATTSASTTSSGRSATARPCRSITKAG